MRQQISSLLLFLLSKTRSQGVGLVDVNGLLVYSEGLHGGSDEEDLAAHLSHLKPSQLEDHVKDQVTEHILIGKAYCFYLRWLPSAPYFVYAMTQAKISGGPVRYALQQAAEALEEILTSEQSASSASERLEQPRQFMRNRLVR